MARQKKSNGRKAAKQQEPKAAKRTSKQEKMERLDQYDRELKARMVKELEQEQKAKEDEPAKETKRTIKAAVIEIFAANAGATNAELVTAIKAEFPESAFKASHASWYRQQLKKGKLTGTKVVIPPKTNAAATASSTAAY